MSNILQIQYSVSIVLINFEIRLDNSWRFYVEQVSGNACERCAAVYQVSGTQFYAGIPHLLHQRKRHLQKKVECGIALGGRRGEVLSPHVAWGTWLSQIQSVHSIMNTAHIIVQQLNLETKPAKRKYVDSPHIYLSASQVWSAVHAQGSNWWRTN